MSLISRLIHRQRNTSRSCRAGFLSVGGASSAARCRRSLRIEPLEVRSLLSVGVSGVVWNDANANGIRDVGEPGIAGAVVELIHNPPADPWTQYSGGVIGVAITDADGRYQLSDLPNWTDMQALVRVPSGYTFTQKVVNDGATVSDVRADGYTCYLPVELRSPVEGDLDTPIIVGDGENHSEVTVNAGVVGAATAFGSAFNLGATGQNTFANGIATDADGNIYVTGSFGGIVDFDPGPGHMNRNSAGQNDVFVAKYTSSGSLLWLRKFGGVGYDRGTALAVGSDGGVYVTGSFVGTVDFDPDLESTYNLVSVGGSDAFTLKLDASGNFVWATRSGGSNPGVSYDNTNGLLLSDSGGDYGRKIVLGADGSLLTLNVIASEANDGSNATFLSKLDSSGNVVWSHQADVVDFALSSDGSIYTAGSASSKWDANGDLVWSREISSGDVAADAAGNVYLYSFVPEADQYGRYHATIRKLDSDGNMLWSSRLNSNALASDGHELTVAADGTLYVLRQTVETLSLGSTWENPGPATSSTEIITVTRFAADGNVISERTSSGVLNNMWFGGPTSFIDRPVGVSTGILPSAEPRPVELPQGLYAYSDSILWNGWSGGLAVGADDSVYVAGFFFRTVDFDPSSAGVYNLTAQGGSDAFLCKWLAPLGAPTDISLSSNTVADSSQIGYFGTIGTFTTADSNPGATFTYTLVDGEGSDGNSTFAISGDRLVLNRDLSNSLIDSYSIRVRATDDAGQWIERVFTINVTDGAPVITIEHPWDTHDTTPTITVTATDIRSGVPDGTPVTVNVYIVGRADIVATETGTMVGGKATISWSSPLPEGNLTLEALVSDAAGHMGLKTTSMNVDATAPTITLGTPTLGSDGKLLFPVIYTDTRTMSHVELKPEDVTVHWTGTARGEIAIEPGQHVYGQSPDQWTWYVSFTNLTGEGTVSISIAAGTGHDEAFNFAPASAESAAFAIGPASFALTGPAAGTVTAGQPVEITWTAANVLPDSTISVCFDRDTVWGNGNETWLEVDKIVAANGSGSYTWDTTGLAAGNYYVGGYLYEHVSATPRFSRLGAPVTIQAAPAPTLALTGPISGTFAPGDTVQITWTAGNLPDGSTISLCCDTDAAWGGAQEHWLKVDQHTANGGGIYSWDTTGFAPGTYYVGGYVYSNGKATFSHLTQPITIATPATGFSVVDVTGTHDIGTPTTIYWTTANAADDAAVSLCYDTDTVWNGNEQWIKVDQPTSAAHSYSWDTTAVAPGTYYIAGYLYANGKATLSHSAQSFTVRTAPAVFGLTAPMSTAYTESRTYTVGETIRLPWTGGQLGANGKVSICYGTAADWTGKEDWIVVDMASTGPGLATWDTTGMTPGDYYIGGYAYVDGKPTFDRLSGPIHLLDSRLRKTVEVSGVLNDLVPLFSGGADATLTVGDTVYQLYCFDAELRAKVHQFSGKDVVVRGTQSADGVVSPLPPNGISVTDLCPLATVLTGHDQLTSAVDSVFAELGA